MKVEFKAWDKESEKMLEWDDLYTGMDFGHILNNADGVYDDFIMLQYTGLKDSQGTKVYRKDILEKEGHPSYYVDFEEGSFVVISTDKVQALSWEHWRLLDMLKLGFVRTGNAYENKIDMLGGK